MTIIRDLKALRRSWRVYFSNPDHDRRLDELYGTYIRPGDLVFDIGAHVGHRTASFLRLGARVIAVEPQFWPASLIRAVYGWRGAKVIRAACGAADGRARLHVNSDNPIVSTLSPEFIAASDGARGWEGQSWDQTRTVRLISLDALIKAYGSPAFIKIDVEGYELDVLAGLTQTINALSFEFTTIQKSASADCVGKCEKLGLTRFNAVIGETHQRVFTAPVSGDELRDWLAALPFEANSGDIYATRA